MGDFNKSCVHACNDLGVVAGRSLDGNGLSKVDSSKYVHVSDFSCVRGLSTCIDWFIIIFVIIKNYS